MHSARLQELLWRWGGLVKRKSFLIENHNYFQALYINAAKHAPQELHKVQDLIIEKELNTRGTGYTTSLIIIDHHNVKECFV